MRENAFESRMAIEVNVAELDRAFLDKALQDNSGVAQLERVGENGIRRKFLLRVTMDRNTGHITKSSAMEEDMKIGANEALITIKGSLTQDVDAKGRISMEALELEDTYVPSTANLSDKARQNLQKMLTDWREAHNIYIVHP